MYEDGMTIAEVLSDALATQQLSQVAAAERIGVAQSVVSRWVNGRDTPSDEHVAQLVKFTGLTKAQVLDAIHAQRVNRQTMLERIRALETAVADLTDLVAALVADRLPDGESAS